MPDLPFDPFVVAKPEPAPAPNPQPQKPPFFSHLPWGSGSEQRPYSETAMGALDSYYKTKDSSVKRLVDAMLSKDGPRDVNELARDVSPSVYSEAKKIADEMIAKSQPKPDPVKQFQAQFPGANIMVGNLNKNPTLTTGTRTAGSVPPGSFSLVQPPGTFGPDLSTVTDSGAATGSSGAGGTGGSDVDAEGYRQIANLAQSRGLMGAETPINMPSSGGQSSGDITKATDYLQKLDDKGLLGAVLGLVGNLADTWGSGRKAYAGIDSPTRMQREFGMRLASQQQANQFAAAAKSEIDKMEPALQKELKYLVRDKQYSLENAIAELRAKFPYDKQLRMLELEIMYQKEASGVPNLSNPELGAASIYK